MGELDLEDDEDTEEEVGELLKEVEEAIAELPENSGSEDELLAAALLLKARGFIAKVRIILFLFTSRVYLYLSLIGTAFVSR
jgi:hypothetical protein